MMWLGGIIGGETGEVRDVAEKQWWKTIPNWDELTWEEKMEHVKRRRRVNLFLAGFVLFLLVVGFLMIHLGQVNFGFFVLKNQLLWATLFVVAFSGSIYIVYHIFGLHDQG